MSRSSQHYRHPIRFLLPHILETEEIERYERGGLHPVHLGDRYDGDRYKIVHKLGKVRTLAGSPCGLQNNESIGWSARSEPMTRRPVTGPLETESGEIPGAEAPKYIVQNLDFLSAKKNIISDDDISLIDFDQAFVVSSPPEKVPGTPVGGVRALACFIVRRRGGESLFGAFDIDSPKMLLQELIEALGDAPASWEDALFDDDGQPTKDPAKGAPLIKPTNKRPPIKELIYDIRDNPLESPPMSQGESVNPVAVLEEKAASPSHQRYSPLYDNKFWKPRALKVGNLYVARYGDESMYNTVINGLPKIPKDEAALLYDPVSKIFVYEPSERVSHLMKGNIMKEHSKDNVGWKIVGYPFQGLPIPTLESKNGPPSTCPANRRRQREREAEESAALDQAKASSANDTFASDSGVNSENGGYGSGYGGGGEGGGGGGYGTGTGSV
ncbi:hypothetical protein B7494_g3279 [Chlorociboria aeruginascens]|nr:hypothetical protein B7494_g3279 [Chlorociboria aeruginascens]